MRKLLIIFMAFVAMSMTFSCNSKEKQIREQQIADSLKKDSIFRQHQADSIANKKKEAELNDEKIEFLKSMYKNVIYPEDAGLSSAYAYAGKLVKHISPKVIKAMTDYDDGIDDGIQAGDASSVSCLYLLGDQGDCEDSPKISYTYLGDNWFKVNISNHTIVKIRVESEPDDDESFMITGLINKDFDINVK